MSRFIELLDRVREHTPRPAGFASTGRSVGEFALIAQAAPAALADDPRLAAIDADAFLLRLASVDDPALPDAVEALSGRIWGIRLPLFTLEQTRTLVGIGCDYVIFDAAGTEAALLTLPDLGIVITVDHRSDEGMIRSLGELAINGLLFRPAIRESPISFHTLANIQRVCGVIDRPLLLELPEGICGTDLEVLRSVETTGLILEVPPADRPAAVRRCMADLPPRSREPHGAARHAVQRRRRRIVAAVDMQARACILSARDMQAITCLRLVVWTCIARSLTQPGEPSWMNSSIGQVNRSSNSAHA